MSLLKSLGTAISAVSSRTPASRVMLRKARSWCETPSLSRARRMRTQTDVIEASATASPLRRAPDPSGRMDRPQSCPHSVGSPLYPGRRLDANRRSTPSQPIRPIPARMFIRTSARRVGVSCRGMGSQRASLRGWVWSSGVGGRFDPHQTTRVPLTSLLHRAFSPARDLHCCSMAVHGRTRATDVPIDPRVLP